MNRQCDEWQKNVREGCSPMRRRTFIESLCGTAAALSLGGCRFPTGARTDDVWAMLEQDRADGLVRGAVFSTADDLVRFVRDLLTRRTFRSAVYDLLFGVAFEKGGARRSFGFDMSADLRPAGLSDRTIYHSGWTGQTICIDPETGFGGVLLTARCGDHARAKVRRRDELAALAASR